VRPIAGRRYEILSGHNRTEASKRSGLTEVPAIVKEDLSDAEAALFVTESNLIQRSFADLKHSERAVTLKNHLEALKKFRGTNNQNALLAFLGDDPSAQVAHKTRSRDKVAESYALSKDTVMRYVRLTKLPRAMLDKVDDGKLKFMVAVELSWMSERELDFLSELLEDDKVNISLKRAKWLRKESAETGGKLTKQHMSAVLNEAAERGRLKLSLSEKMSDRLTEYNITSEKSIEMVISLYLDMLERGETENVFSD
jgi:ParB family chromosome partitioning protein